jgi:hypothetical protein
VSHDRLHERIRTYYAADPPDEEQEVAEVRRFPRRVEWMTFYYSPPPDGEAKDQKFAHSLPPELERP